METKTSFPLKKEKNHNDFSKDQIQETKKLIHSIIRKSKKFFEIAINKQKTIQKIHILFLYDSLLQTNEEIKLYKKKIMIFLKIYQ